MKTNKLNSAIYITPSRVRFANSFKEQEVKAGLKEFLNENKIIPGYIVSCIPRTEVSIKYLSFPTLNDSELKAMVEFELNNLLPLKPEEMVYDYAIIRKGPGDYSHLMLVVAPKEAVLKHTALLEEAGLIPDEVTVSTISLYKQFLSAKRPEASYLLINVDDNFLDMVYINDKKLAFSRGVALSSVGEIPNAIKDIEFTATVLKDKEYAIDKIILCGGLNLQELAAGLEKVLPYKVEIDTSLGVLKGSLDNKGGALKINLLPEELRLKKRAGLRKRAFAYLLIILLVNLSLLANIAFMKIKSKQEYLSLLKSEISKIDDQASGLQKKLVNVQILRGYINSDRLTLWLLSELYRIAPDGIVFASLDISNREDQGTMMIAGQAKDSDMVLALANSLKETAFIKSAEVVRITKRARVAQDTGVDFEIKSNFAGYK
ncbi:MAG TPA: pilus assembly protein PilM [Candidatus Margulisiibacteriota bacterium]|nr:pilus assembly protein PilM [Candidatus Margulisiibacteriota bacterium]